MQSELPKPKDANVRFDSKCEKVRQRHLPANVGYELRFSVSLTSLSVNQSYKYSANGCLIPFSSAFA